MKKFKGRISSLTVSEVSVYHGQKVWQGRAKQLPSQAARKKRMTMFVFTGPPEVSLSLYQGPQRITWHLPQSRPVFFLSCSPACEPPQEMPSQTCLRICLAIKLIHQVNAIREHSVGQVWWCTLSGGRSRRLTRKFKLAGYTQ